MYEEYVEMKIGLCMPYMVRDYDRDRILTWARKIDAGPFDTLSCGERITDYTISDGYARRFLHLLPNLSTLRCN